MPEISRVIIIVLDSCGVGALPDAQSFGDAGTNTLGHVSEAAGGLDLPNFARMGLGNIIPVYGVPPTDHPKASWGRMAEKSAGKDTTTGHWEMAGVVTPRPFPIYPNGFPPEVLTPFEEAIGRKTIGNCPASGTEIIKELGEEHLKTGRPIIYTSADSVFQIACHEEVVPVEKLYEWCRMARNILREPHNVLRVIARPFIGRPGDFTRTERRRDFSFPAPGRTILDAVCESGGEVTAIGKIEDVFSGRGITKAIHTPGNDQGMEATISSVRSGHGRLIFTNLVDFDMLYGHRNDPEGYARALESFDRKLAALTDALSSTDLLIITADHGCDPTTPGTDHTREYVPLLVHSPAGAFGRELGTRSSFCDVAATAAELFDLPPFECGTSFASLLIN